MKSLINNKIPDLFGVICHDNIPSKHDTFEYIDNFISNKNITKVTINWPDIIHIFYQDQLNFDKEFKILLMKKIQLIITGENTNKRIDYLQRFLHLNGIFEMINKFNASYNQTINIQNYTLKMLQTYCLEQIIINNNDTINHWFEGIFNINLNLYDGIHKTKYHKGIDILKHFISISYNTKYFLGRNELINSFINKYAIWISNKLTKYYYNNNITLTTLFDKVDEIYLVNKIFMNDILQDVFKTTLITSLVPCWEKYLSNILDKNLSLDTKIIDKYNSVDLVNNPNLSNFYYITVQFMKKWHDKIKLNINPKYYCDSKLFESVLNISQIIIFKNSDITKYIKNLFNIDKTFLEYIMVGLNILIKNIYISNEFVDNIDVNNLLLIIALNDDKNEIWNLYFNHIYSRIINSSKQMRITKKIVEFEINMFNILVSNECNEFDESSNNVKTLLNNLDSSSKYIDNVHKLQINYQNKDGKDINTEIKDIDVSKLDYTIFDSTIRLNNDKIVDRQLIEYDKYPKEIKTYLMISKTYFDVASETLKIDWDVEYSIINYNIDKLNIISNIIQYTIISTVIIANKLNKTISKEQLINYIVNKDNLIDENKQYIKMYLLNIIDANIIVINNNNLIINNKIIEKIETIDISVYTPTKIITSEPFKEEKEEKKEVDEYIMTDQCLTYLRILMLINMFKHNSSTHYTCDNIYVSLPTYIDRYIEINKFSLQLQKILNNLIDVNNSTLLNDLKTLEKRDIIEETPNGYIYVL